MDGKRTWLGPSFVVTYFLLYTITAGTVYIFSALIVFIQDEFKLPLALIEWLGALPFSISRLAAPVAMVLNFKIGTWGVLLLGTILTTLGLGLSGLAQNVGILFFTYGSLAAFGMTLLISPPAFLIDQIYPYHHPRHVLATSIALCGSPLAALILVAPADAIAVAFGWRATYVVLAVSFLIIGLSSVILARLLVKCKTVIDSDDKRKVNEEDKIQIPSKRKIMMFVLWFIVSLMKCYAFCTPLVTLIKHMDSLGVSRDISWKVMPVFGASGLVSRFLASYFGDKIKGKTLYMYFACCFILGVINLFGPIFSNYIHFMLYGAGLGLLGGPLLAAVYACSAEVLGGEEVPSLFSIFRTAMGVAILVGPVIAGAIHDTFGTFQPMFYSYSSIYFFTAFIYAVIIALNKWYPLNKPQDKANLLQSITTVLKYQTLSNEEKTLESGS